MLVLDKFFKLFLLVLVLALLITAYFSTLDQKESSPEKRYRLTSTECSFSVYFEGLVECWYLQLFTPNRTVNLPVTVIKARREGDTSKQYSSSPLLYFSGGPGAGVGVDSESIHHWLGWYELAGLDRDLVLFDRRSVGYSTPKHKCPSYDRFSRGVLTENLTTAEEMRRGRSIILRCFERLNKSPALQHGLGSLLSSEDAGQLMLALGYSKWHLFGVSYGSRLALVHANAYPSNVGKIIFDSIYPLGRGVLDEWPNLLDGALSRYFSYCLENRKCSAGFSGVSPEAAFWQAMASLKGNPVRLRLDDWQGGEIVLLLNDHRFLSAVFSALYDVNSIEKIAPAISAVLNGEKNAVEKLMTPFVNYSLDESFNPWAYWMVECAENRASKSTFMTARKNFPALAPYLEGVYEFDVCKQLRREGLVYYSAIDAGILQHESLVLAGGLDPITPAKWAGEFHKKGSNTLLWALPGVGHAVAENSVCVHAQLEGFLSDGDAWLPKDLCSGELSDGVKKAP